jgi:hypothetical protein
MKRLLLIIVALLTVHLVPFGEPATAAEESINKLLLGAVLSNDMGTVRRVIGEGADPFATDNTGLAAVDVAVDRGYFDIAHYLLAVQNQQVQAGRANEVVSISDPRNPVMPEVVPLPSVSVTSKELVSSPIAPEVENVEVRSNLEPAYKTKLVKVVPPQTVQLIDDQPTKTTPPVTTRAAFEDKVPASNIVETDTNDQSSNTELPDVSSKTLVKNEDLEVSLFDQLTNFFKTDKQPEKIQNSPAELISVAPYEEQVIEKNVDQLKTAVGTKEFKSENNLAQITSINKQITQTRSIEVNPPQTVIYNPTQANTLGEPIVDLAPKRDLSENLNEVSGPAATRSESNVTPSSPSSPQSEQVNAEPLPRITDSRKKMDEAVDVAGLSINEKDLDAQPKVKSATINQAPPSTLEPKARSIFDQITDFLKPDPMPENVGVKARNNDDTSKNNALISELNKVDTVPELKEANKTTPTDKEKTSQAVAHLAPANLAASAPHSVSEPEPTLLKTPIKKPIRLGLGSVGRIGKVRNLHDMDDGSCIWKPGKNTAFCIESIDWSNDIKSAFQKSSHYASGGRAIVRYDNGQSSQYHVSFPAKSFALIANFLKQKLGVPSETPDVWTSMLGEPNRFNKTLRWRVAAKDGGVHQMIEIREIDDLRWSSPPDLKNGVVRLYKEGAKPVFSSLTSADLLLMQLRIRARSVEGPAVKGPKG